MVNRNFRLVSLPFNQGFTYIEALASLVIVTIMTGAMGPLFMNERQRNLESELSTAAASLAKRCLENIRQRTPSDLVVGTATTPPACTLPAGATTVLGRTLQISTTIRIPDNVIDAQTNPWCPPTGRIPRQAARCVLVQVSLQNRSLYETSTVYTQL